MRLLGAILAGGQSSRFGSDKALALHAGTPLIGHVAQALARQSDSLVICGREWGGYPCLPDSPGPGLGPMGGLCAALHHAEANGFDQILAAPCDVLGLPHNIRALLSPAPAVAEGQWLVGLWPAPMAGTLNQLLLDEGPISARRWALAISARIVPVRGIRNINRPDDLI